MAGQVPQEDRQDDFYFNKSNMTFVSNYTNLGDGYILQLPSTITTQDRRDIYIGLKSFFSHANNNYDTLYMVCHELVGNMNDGIPYLAFIPSNGLGLTTNTNENNYYANNVSYYKVKKDSQSQSHNSSLKTLTFSFFNGIIGANSYNITSELNTIYACISICTSANYIKPGRDRDAHRITKTR